MSEREPVGSAVQDKDLARETWEKMRDLTHDPEVLGQVHVIAVGAGISPGSAKALRHLSATEPRPMRQLATELRCDSSYITTIVDNLEEAGLARRQAHATDRRIKVVVLTEAGQAVSARVAAVLGTPPPAFEALSGEEMHQLSDLLAKMTVSAKPRW